MYSHEIETSGYFSVSVAHTNVERLTKNEAKSMVVRTDALVLFARSGRFKVFGARCIPIVALCCLIAFGPCRTHFETGFSVGISLAMILQLK
jgi:hypothetical protein